MKKKSSPDLDDDLRPEYGPELFRSMKPNRFAGMDLKFKGRRAVLLDEDVAEVFDQESVNTVLRSAMKAMRTAAPKKTQASAKKAKAAKTDQRTRRAS
jgi:hypothetical protein